MVKKVSLFITLSVATLKIDAQKDIVYFDNDSYELSALTKQKLDSLTHAIMDENHTDELLITGHTDIDGTDDYNKVLSSNRAQAVYNYLSKKGLTNRVRIVSCGETVNVNANKNDDEKSLNRRVEISRKAYKQPDFFGNEQDELQTFNIHPLRDTTLHCMKGTIIWVKGNSLQTTDYTTPVQFYVREYYQKPEFVFANLITKTTANELLESSGMIHIEATQGSKVLELKPESEIQILFTGRKEDDNAEIFYGQSVNDEIVWVMQDKTTVAVRSNYIETPRSLTRYEWNERTTTRVSRRAIRHSDKEGFSLVYDNSELPQVSPSYDENVGLMNNLVMSSGKLGWINCDSFIKSKKPKTDVIVECTEGVVPRVCMVFKSRNAVLSYSYSMDNQYVFQNIPSGTEVELIGLHKDTASGTVLFAKESFVVGQSERVALNFREADLESIKSEIKSL